MFGAMSAREVSTREELRSVALAEFANAGYLGTSLQRIAEAAGVSKSNVLYHFASKEALLDAAIAPAIDRLEAILTRTSSEPFTAQSRDAFIVQFVDFLLESRLEVNMFLNHGRSLEDVPVIDRANALVVRLADYFATATTSTEGFMRFGVALGGAAFILSSHNSFGHGFAHLPEPPVDEVRAALVIIVSELLAPLAVSSSLE